MRARVPGIAVGVHGALAIGQRAVPDQLKWPAKGSVLYKEDIEHICHLPEWICEHILAAEAVDTRRLGEEAALPVEDALPGVEEHIATCIHHRQVSVSLSHYGVQILHPVWKINVAYKFEYLFATNPGTN